MPSEMKLQHIDHFFQVSNEKNLGWLGYIGDDKLPSYIGIIINHYKDPVINHPGFNGK